MMKMICPIEWHSYSKYVLKVATRELLWGHLPTGCSMCELNNCWDFLDKVDASDTNVNIVWIVIWYGGVAYYHVELQAQLREIPVEVTRTSLHATTLTRATATEHPLSLKGRIRRFLLFLAHTFFLEGWMRTHRVRGIESDLRTLTIHFIKLS